jgi:hypothetical protein
MEVRSLGVQPHRDAGLLEAKAVGEEVAVRVETARVHARDETAQS